MSDSPLPPLYDRWITELTGVETRGEPQATCLDCAMLDTEPGAVSFHPATKCCTYTPALPNYLVGAALADPRLDPVDGRTSLKARIARRAGVDPLGVLPDAVTSILAQRTSGAFGMTPELRCPHYHQDTGKCGVWLHRNAICSTWFCKHERGAVGMAFFHALRDLLEEAERDLARYCVLTLGAPYHVARASDDRGSRLTPHDLAGEVDDAEYRRRWGDWTGRELELYAEAHALVRDLSWADVVAVCGPELGLRMRAFEAARQQRDHTFVPAALVVRKLNILAHGDPYVLQTYWPPDPIAIPQVLFDLLPRFRGQSTAEARAEIAREANIDLDDELLVRLVDFEVLSDAEK